MTTPTGVHLVGSVPLSDSSEVFRTACSECPMERSECGPIGSAGSLPCFTTTLFSRPWSARRTPIYRAPRLRSEKRCAQYDIVLMLKKRVADALIPAPMVFEKRVGQMRPLNPGDWLGEEARPWDDDDGASCGGCAVCRGGSVRPWCGRTGGSSIRGVCPNAAWRSGTS